MIEASRAPAATSLSPPETMITSSRGPSIAPASASSVLAGSAPSSSAVITTLSGGRTIAVSAGGAGERLQAQRAGGHGRGWEADRRRGLTPVEGVAKGGEPRVPLERLGAR